MTRAFKGLEGLCRLLILAAFLVLSGSVLLQVFARTFLSSAPVWTEELTRFCLIYIGALGAGLALRSGDMVNVDLLCERLPGRAPWVLRLICAVLTAGFAIALLSAAWRYTAIGSRQTAASLGVRMDFIHASMLILFITLALWALMRVFEMLTGRHDGRPVRSAEEI
ncbi:MAG: TRAP transporter small permease [Pseudotabrizicola sp.]|uniref:TRAP transporter small permease n=1 Tax=Pseudotabrizicola sp. TaxID=2939647 RepID=UPI0027192D75|nr:TRAP transporter small permease [Pseudotabrizicola sp.]MDO9639107.1 TRAP transporter small permease [Pseudotabrizicola sp.]